MSTNKTQNYQLHSWLPDDEFHLTEINENFAALDAALKAEATAATSGRTSLNTALTGQLGQLNTTLSGQIGQLNTALQSEITTRTQQIAGKADKTEVAEKVTVITGTYTGTGRSSTTRVTLGVKPKGLVAMMYPSYGTSTILWAVTAPGSNFQNAVLFDATGFTVQYNGNSLLDLNVSGSVYHYIAFC